MKRTLLAMAVGAAFLPLVAQAAPEFYGRLNVSLSNESGQDFAGDSTLSSVDVSSIQNWVGIRGQADLYNQNLKAIYQVERGIDITDGSGNMTARNTFVGLAGDNWGKVFLGTYDSVVKKAEGKVDLFNHTEADMQFTGIAGQNRFSNTINYSSPNISGLTFNAQIIPAEGNRNDATGTSTPPEHGLTDGYGVSVNFTQDAFWANLAYEKSAENGEQASLVYDDLPFPGTGSTAPDDYKVQTLRLSAGISIGNIDLAALVQQRKADDQLADDVTSGSVTKTQSKNDYVLSGRFAVTDQLAVKAQLIQAGGQYLVDTDDRKVEAWTVGADYALGKNVTSYVLYSSQSISDKVGGTKDKSEANVASVGLTLKF